MMWLLMISIGRQLNHVLVTIAHSLHMDMLPSISSAPVEMLRSGKNGTALPTRLISWWVRLAARMNWVAVSTPSSGLRSAFSFMLTTPVMNGKDAGMARREVNADPEAQSVFRSLES